MELKDKRVLIVGGYGVVGNQIAFHLRKKYPDIRILIGGRDLNKGKKLAHILGGAEAVYMDVLSNNLKIPDEIHLIINVVNDPNNIMINYSREHIIPLIDVTRWPDKFREAIKLINSQEFKSSIILSSGWMGGGLATITKLYSKGFKQIEKIDISCLYSLKDKAGPNSVEYIDQLSKPFQVGKGHKEKIVMPLSDGKVVKFPNGYKIKTYRMDTPDHITLLDTVSANEVNFRIAFDNRLTMYGLVFLVKSKVWKLLSGVRFKTLRRGILYHPGNGGSHHVVIDIEGLNDTGDKKKKTITVTDNQGQTHFTAISIMVQVSKLLENPNWKPSTYYPEQFPDDEINEKEILSYFSDNEVSIKVYS